MTSNGGGGGGNRSAAFELATSKRENCITALRLWAIDPGIRVFVKRPEEARVINTQTKLTIKSIKPFLFLFLSRSRSLVPWVFLTLAVEPWRVYLATTSRISDKSTRRSFKKQFAAAKSCITYHSEKKWQKAPLPSFYPAYRVCISEEHCRRSLGRGGLKFQKTKKIIIITVEDPGEKVEEREKMRNWDFSFVLRLSERGWAEKHCIFIYIPRELRRRYRVHRETSPIRNICRMRVIIALLDGLKLRARGCINAKWIRHAIGYIMMAD